MSGSPAKSDNNGYCMQIMIVSCNGEDQGLAVGISEVQLSVMDKLCLNDILGPYEMLESILFFHFFALI